MALRSWRLYVELVKTLRNLLSLKLLKGDSDILGDSSIVKGVLRGLLIEKPKLSLQKWRVYIELRRANYRML